MDLITLARLPHRDQVRLKNSSKVAQALEDAWAAKVSSLVDSFIAATVASKINSTPMPRIDFEPILVEHFFEVSIRSMRYAISDTGELDHLPPRAGIKLAFPKVRIPKTLHELMRQYDAFRRGGAKPKRPVKQAKELKTAYLDKVASVWEKHSEDFRNGDTATQELVIKKIKEAAKTTSARAANIVRTETTSYYNAGRKAVYDESQDISHYLFIAIRDAATSPWCTPLTIDGKRGRSGLVYAKSDPLCAKECPACHPNCRSEFLPLNRLNPSHLRFIQDEKIARRNHTCFPLLQGWSGG